ncbi:MAG: cytochrome c3 family protein [Candidatus Delongbacteria bacterium]|nr:cytochrome c3 family protein [Candidatus Delongbacteria bacterium]
MRQRLLPALYLLLFPLLLFAGVEMNVIFPHGFHVEDVGVACDQCHSGVDDSSTGLDNLLPEMDICLSCHDGDTAGDDCAQCHLDLDDPQPAPRISAYLPKFSHAAHVADVTCEQCHGGVTASMESTSRHLPQMSLCMECHSTPLTIEGCQLCHNAQESLLPLDHGPDWVKMHAAVEQDRCDMCHSVDQCEDCHTGTAGEILFHDENHLLTHGLDYQMRDTDCSLCHTDNTSCRECHNANVIQPLWHLDIDYLNGVHGAEALIDPAYCLLCHGDEAESCDECH